MKNVLIGLLTLLLICSTALNVFMFVQLDELLRSSPQTPISSNISANADSSVAEVNATTSNFNTALIGKWTDGTDGYFYVMEDGTAYVADHSFRSEGIGDIIYSMGYGYMDGSNFVVTKRYRYETVDNGGDGIYRHSEEEVIANCLTDVNVHTYRIILEGNTITGFGDTNNQFVKDSN